MIAVYRHPPSECCSSPMFSIPNHVFVDSLFKQFSEVLKNPLTETEFYIRRKIQNSS